MIVGSAALGACPICGAGRCHCGPDGTATDPIDIPETKEPAMPGPLKVYDVERDGIKTQLRLSDEDAKRLGLTGAKKRSAANKARPAPQQAPERPAGNASTKEWAAYAAKVGVQVDDDAGRDDIIAAVDSA